MKQIRIFDYLEQYQALESDIHAAIRRALESGRIILGPERESFEQEFGAFLSGEPTAAATPVHCVGVANGTDAISVILRALGAGHGDEVITVSNTAVPTVSAIRETGAIPVFCDVDAHTCLMDLDRVAECFSERTKAVIPVHLFGNVVDVPRLRSIIGDRDISIIEDCAQCHGASLRGAMAGTMGTAAAFSFYPTKNLGAYGDGGMCVTGDPELAAVIRSVRMYGFDGLYYAEREGVNSRLDEIQAAILRVKLPHLHNHVENRRRIAATYDAMLPAAAEPIATSAGAIHAYHLYVVRVDNRDDVRARLSDKGIGTGVHYPFPIHLMRGYDFLGYQPGDLPVTERLAGEILSLPIYPELPPADAERVCVALREVIGE